MFQILSKQFDRTLIIKHAHHTNMRRDHHVGQLPKWTVGRKRLFIKHIQRGAGDLPFLQRGISAFWSTTPPRAMLIRYADGFIAASSAAPTIPRVSVVSGVVTMTKSQSFIMERIAGTGTGG
jgi:hypothetical protein